MVETRTTTKATKKRKFVDLTFECDDATLKRLNELADLAAVTLSQAISVILAMYILELKVVKGEGFEKPKDVKKRRISREASKRDVPYKSNEKIHTFRLGDK